MSKELNLDDMRELLLASGYSEKAVDYFMNQPFAGRLDDADQVEMVTGECGDSMRMYLKADRDRIVEGRVQVMGCPGAIAAANALLDMVRGMSFDEALAIKDGELFDELKGLPDEKQDCIRLALKTLARVIESYREKGGEK